MTFSALLIASTNPGKILEIKDTLQALRVHVPIYGLNDFEFEESDEPFQTFQENAIHKAKYYAKQFNMPALADDSGLCIDILEGYPGVQTKEFSQKYAGNSSLILEKLNEKIKNVTPSNTDNRVATFYTSVALYDPVSETLIVHEDKCEGALAFIKEGVDRPGMCFDSIWIPKGYTQTLACLDLSIKNTIGHRALAVKALVDKAFC